MFIGNDFPFFSLTAVICAVAAVHLNWSPSADWQFVTCILSLNCWSDTPFRSICFLSLHMCSSASCHCFVPSDERLPVLISLINSDSLHPSFRARMTMLLLLPTILCLHSTSWACMPTAWCRSRIRHLQTSAKRCVTPSFLACYFFFNDIQNSHRIDDADSIISAVCDRGTRKIRRARAAIRRGLKLMPMWRRGGQTEQKALMKWTT